MPGIIQILIKDKNAVLSDMSRNLKDSMSSDLIKPRMSVCDPTYTFSVPKGQTAAGTADMISHAFENYFSPIKDAFMVEKTAGLQTRLFRSRRRTCWRSLRTACEISFCNQTGVV